MKKLILTLVLIMSLSFAFANNDTDPNPKDSKIEKVELNKKLEMILLMSKKNSKKLFVKKLFRMTQICSNTDRDIAVNIDGKWYIQRFEESSVPGMAGYYAPPLEVTIDEVTAFCTAPGGSWN